MSRLRKAKTTGDEDNEPIMNATNDSVTVQSHVVFKGQDYTEWKKRIKLMLRARGLEQVLKNKGTEYERVKGLEIIVNHLDNSVFRLLKEEDSPYELLRELDSKYGESDSAAVVSLRLKLANMNINDFTSAKNYVDEVSNLVIRLQNCNETVSPEQHYTYLIQGLNDRFDNVRAAASAVLHVKKADPEIAKSLILQEDKRRGLTKETRNINYVSTHKGAAMISNDRCYVKNYDKKPKCFRCNKYGHIGKNCRTYGDAQRNVRPDDPPKCFRCNKHGHIGRNCPRYGDNVNGSSNSTRKDVSNTRPANDTSTNSTNSSTRTSYTAKLAALTAGNNCADQCNDTEIEFVVDSGATAHMINQRGLLIHETKFEDANGITTAKKNIELRRESIGELIVESEFGERFKMSQVVFVPDLVSNLLSVKVLRQRGYDVVFSEKVEIIRRQTGEIIANVEQDVDGLFKVRFRPVYNSDSVEFALINRDQELIWHRRLGHPGVKVLSKVLGVTDCGDNNLTITSCSVCAKAKQTKNSYDSVRRRAEFPLEIIHTDIMGPMSDSIDGEKYIVTFLDDYTHYAVTFVMQHRSDVGDYFINFERKAATKFNRIIVTIRCDNAQEYMGGKFRDHCNLRGITLQPAEPYEHQHNGTAERWNRTLREKMLALLCDSKLPDKFWNYACYAATYLLNRLPSSAIEYMTPYEKWTGMKPNYQRVKVFGCVARVFIPTEKRSKLQPKSKDMILVGYCDTGYVVIDPVTNTAQLTSNVICDETKNYSDLMQLNDNILVVEESNNGNDESHLDADLDHALQTLNEDLNLTYDDALSGPEAKNWEKAIENELQAMRNNNVWDVVKSSEIGDSTIIDMKWVFRKKHENGQVLYKARLVARGYKDGSRYEIEEIYAPTATVSSIRALVNIATVNDWPLKHIDVSNAFLNGIVSRDIFVTPPKGTFESDDTVYKLNRSIYGLKSAPKSWNDRLHAALLKFGLVQSVADSCLYSFKSDQNRCLLLIYVDDILITGYDENLISENLREFLSREFKIKYLGDAKKFVGIEINRNADTKTTYLSQRDYISDLLLLYGLQNCNPVKVPMDPGLKIEKKAPDPAFETKVRGLIGALAYIARGTRPDIGFSVNFLSRYQANATEEIFNYAKKILRYLKGTIDLKLTYTNEVCEILSIYVDSDFAGDRTDRKSTTGVIVRMFGNFIDWSVNKQSATATSTAEAEYIALSTAGKLAGAWKNVLESIGFEVKNIPVFCDSSAAISIASTTETKRTRHIDVSYHHVRDLMKNGTINLRKIKSSDQLADLLTKAATRAVFEKLRDQIFGVGTK